MQFRLAETVHVLEAAELMVLDAGRRADHGDARAEIAAALAWVYAFDAGQLVEKHTHQVFGAAGFAEEVGLIRLTYQIAWLRASIGIDDALDHLSARRARADGVHRRPSSKASSRMRRSRPRRCQSPWETARPHERVGRPRL